MLVRFGAAFAAIVGVLATAVFGEVVAQAFGTSIYEPAICRGTGVDFGCPDDEANIRLARLEEKLDELHLERSVYLNEMERRLAALIAGAQGDTAGTDVPAPSPIRYIAAVAAPRPGVPWRGRPFLPVQEIPVQQTAYAVTGKTGLLRGRKVAHAVSCLDVPEGFEVVPGSVRISRRQEGRWAAEPDRDLEPRIGDFRALTERSGGARESVVSKYGRSGCHAVREGARQCVVALAISGSQAGAASRQSADCRIEASLRRAE